VGVDIVIENILAFVSFEYIQNSNYRDCNFVCSLFKVKFKMSQSQFNVPPAGLVLKRKLNKHAVGIKHVRGDKNFLNNQHYVAKIKLTTPLFFPMVDTVGNYQDNSVHPPQEDFGGEGAYDDYNEIMEAHIEEVDILSDDSENELDQRNDDGEHLCDRHEPVDDDDTNLADMMAQNSLDDFYVHDLTKDEKGNYRNQEIEPILPRVTIMVRFFQCYIF